MTKKILLKELMSGDRFIFIKPYLNYPKEEVFVFNGVTDIYVYGSNAFDVFPEYEEDNVFAIENTEVIFVGGNAYGYNEQS
jgi:hypothetical protein